jgi:hypothetical protein
VNDGQRISSIDSESRVGNQEILLGQVNRVNKIALHSRVE